jgi:hypothetical protein
MHPASQRIRNRSLHIEKGEGIGPQRLKVKYWGKSTNENYPVFTGKII